MNIKSYCPLCRKFMGDIYGVDPNIAKEIPDGKTMAARACLDCRKTHNLAPFDGPKWRKK